MARPIGIGAFSAAEHYRLLASTKLCYLVNRAHGCYLAVQWPRDELATS